MRKFIATRFESDGEYAETFEAGSLEKAEMRCLAEGWQFDGEVKHIIPVNQTTEEEMNETIDALNERDVSVSQ